MSFLFGGRRTGPPAASPEQTQHFAGVGSGSGTRSLELVRYNADTGKFEVGDEALAVLRSTRGPIGVVAVAGRARQGKSYILNQLLGRSGGFAVGPTHRPCTKGLWMWSAPVERAAADGSKYSLVLLDTEGIDAYDQVSVVWDQARVSSCVCVCLRDSPIEGLCGGPHTLSSCQLCLI